MKLKVLERYKDIELDRYVESGEIIEVSPQRHKELIEKEKEIGRSFFEEVKEDKKVKVETEKVETKAEKTETKPKTRRKSIPSEK